MLSTIHRQLTTCSRLQEFDFNNVEFGLIPTDHLLHIDYRGGKWQNPAIKPFQNLSLSPMALCLHYGQTVFEGFRAFRMADGSINVFRPDKHYARLQKSLDRMCMPAIPEDLFLESVDALVETDQAWVSGRPGHSLYLRPLVIATEARLGVKVSDEYAFILMATPMTNYYNGNLKVKVETSYVRAVAGGAGYAKNGGNYGAAFYPTQLARQQGFDQVIWTDGIEHLYLEESGVMNLMFIIDGILITPALSGTILDGVTRDSVLALARDAGIPVEERRISYLELKGAFDAGKRVEAFGVGTAAVVTPIELIDIQGRAYYPDVALNARLFQFRDQLQAIRTGKAVDRHGWNHIITQYQLS
jgi:branched-chain amino acid aminotransferase